MTSCMKGKLSRFGLAASLPFTKVNLIDKVHYLIPRMTDSLQVVTVLKAFT